MRAQTIDTLLSDSTTIDPQAGRQSLPYFLPGIDVGASRVHYVRVVGIASEVCGQRGAMEQLFSTDDERGVVVMVGALGVLRCSVWRRMRDSKS
jgi:hypothetical protein